MKRLLVSLAMIALGTVTAQAQNGITLGEPSYGGTGCPQGTANAVLSADGRALSILYDQYVAETGGGRSFDRKSCNLAIPLNIPQGYSVSIVGVDYRGFNYLPAGGSSTFRVEYFFAGGQGPIFQQDFAGPRDDDFLIHNDIGLAAAVWSDCGVDVNLRTNSSIRVQSSEQAIVTIDSEDIDAAIIFQLQWRQC